MKNFPSLYILPFIFFIIGYLTFSYWFCQKVIKTPSIIGMSLDQAALSLAESNLNFRLLSFKDDSELPMHTIIHQLPHPGQIIRPQSSIFCVVSKKGTATSIPDFRGKKINEIHAALKDKYMNVEIFQLPSCMHADYCFAQSPVSDMQSENKKITLYVAQSADQRMLLPSFIGFSIRDIVPLLDTYDLKAEIFHLRPQSITHKCTNCRITEQKPLPGSIIDLKQPSSLQFLVE